MTIRVVITSQDRPVYSGDADIVVVPGTLGEMGILPNHSPLLSTMKFGVIKVRHKGEELVFTVAGGVVEVQPDQVTILADAAENVDEIDITRADAARKRAEELLAKGLPQDSDAYLTLQAALQRSNLRLDSVRRYRKSRI
jgi:F-type H+-transporting ATPase subunit epsilon